jgi:hypothetical protein
MKGTSVFQKLKNWIQKRRKERRLEREAEENDTLTELSWVEHSVPRVDMYGNSKGVYS